MGSAKSDSHWVTTILVHPTSAIMTSKFLWVFSLLLLHPAIIRSQPVENEDTEPRQQKLVGKIIDLIKREQIRNEIIEEDNAILNENEVIIEVNEMVETNSLEEMEEAVNRVTHVMEYDPVFDPSTVHVRQDDVELDEDEEEEEETSLEDIVVGVYQALPKDVQKGIREGYEYAAESYNNVTSKLKREWYNFQIETNALVNDLFGDGEEDDDDADEKNDIEYFTDGGKPPGTSKLSIFDVMFDYIEDLWDNLFGEGSKHFLRIYKRSLPLKKDRKLLKTILRNLRILNHRRRKVKRDVYLPSLGIAGEIVNDVANTFINTATVWKYQ